MDRIEVGGTLGRLRQQLRNWYWVGGVSWLVMLSPARHLLENSALARRVITLRFRDGRVLRFRINDMAAFVEVFLLGDYEIPGSVLDDATSIIDVGANCGAATVWFAGRAPHARITAVEPGPAARELLEWNVAANGLGERVVVMAAALGSERSRGRFVQAQMSIQSHVSLDAGADGEDVEVMRVDDVLTESGMERVDILKIDCEGGEYDILLNSSEGWLSRVGSIAGEYHPSDAGEPEQIISKLEAAGFTTELHRHPALEGFGNFFATRAVAATA